MRVKPSSPLIWFATLAVLAGGGLLYSVTRPAPAASGALEVRPATLTLNGATPATLNVRNVGPSTITVHAAIGDRAPKVMLVDPATAIARPGASVTITVRQVDTQDRHFGETTQREPSVVISAGSDRVEVPVTLAGDPGPATGSGIRVEQPDVVFARGVAAVSRTISNAGSAPLTWKAAPPRWLRLTPASGTIDAGRSVVVRLDVDRSTLDLGETTAKVPITSAAGEAAFDVTIHTTADPILTLVTPSLDFGLGGPKTTKTLAFRVRNAGRAELRFQASADRAFLKLALPASGALDPGESATLSLTFDFAETKVSNEWTAEVPISSNGGSAVLAVTGMSDWSAPAMLKDSNEMKTAHDHCSGGSCERFRHLRMTLEDPSRITRALARFRVCTGSGEAPACEEWQTAPAGRRVSGSATRGVYQIEIGPLPERCVPGVGVIVHYRLELADGLGNAALRPGSSTYYGYLHCSRAD